MEKQNAETLFMETARETIERMREKNRDEKRVQELVEMLREQFQRLNGKGKYYDKYSLLWYSISDGANNLPSCSLGDALDRYNTLVFLRHDRGEK